jgi:hypothetical protein
MRNSGSWEPATGSSSSPTACRGRARSTDSITRCCTWASRRHRSRAPGVALLASREGSSVAADRLCELARLNAEGRGQCSALTVGRLRGGARALARGAALSALANGGRREQITRRRPAAPRMESRSLGCRFRSAGGGGAEWSQRSLTLFVPSRCLERLSGDARSSPEAIARAAHAEPPTPSHYRGSGSQRPALDRRSQLRDGGGYRRTRAHARRRETRPRASERDRLAESPPNTSPDRSERKLR